MLTKRAPLSAIADNVPSRSRAPGVPAKKAAAPAARKPVTKTEVTETSETGWGKWARWVLREDQFRMPDSKQSIHR